MTGEVEPGEALALIGPNGAGKTTLLKGIVGSTALADGTMSIDRRGALGYVPQVADLDPTFPVTVAQVVGMGLYGELGWFQRLSRRHKERIAQALDRVGFADRGDVHFGTLSGGQRQRVLLARAIVADPTIILLDEPFNGLDQPNRAALMEIIQWVKGRGVALVISTHDFDLAEQTCDKVALLAGHQVALVQVSGQLSRRTTPGINQGGHIVHNGAYIRLPGTSLRAERIPVEGIIPHDCLHTSGLRNRLN